MPLRATKKKVSSSVEEALVCEKVCVGFHGLQVTVDQPTGVALPLQTVPRTPSPRVQPRLLFPFLQVALDDRVPVAYALHENLMKEFSQNGVGRQRVVRGPVGVAD